jgi:uncharacterized membrane protein YbhN (UPF0104 family)
MTDTQDRQGHHRKEGHRKDKYKLLKRLLTVAFFVLIAVMLYFFAKGLDWKEVWHALKAFKPSALLLASAFTLASYMVYSAFDLVGKVYARHDLPARQILPVTFVCYAFNLNLGSWVGGIALRYRLYSRLGLSNGKITQVLSMSLLTNWFGYILLAGPIFLLGLQLPENWSLGSGALRAIGAALVAVSLAYLLACRFSRKRTWQIRRFKISLPSLRLAAIQGALGALNWALMALVVYALLPDKAAFTTVLCVLLISSIAGVITHIPAGLGVLEAVFIAMLQHELSKGSILAALIGYRAIYFLVPLLVASVVYLMLEAAAKKLRKQNNASASAKA